MSHLGAIQNGSTAGVFAASEPCVAQRFQIGATPTFREQAEKGSKDSFSRPSRPALRGGVTGGEPPLYSAQKSNVWIALGGAPALPFRAGGKRPWPGPKTADRHNRATGARHRVSPTRWGWDATHSPEGPQTPSNGPTRGKRREGRPAHAKRPRHGSHGLLKRGGFRLLLELEFFVGETLRRGNSKMLQPPG